MSERLFLSVMGKFGQQRVEAATSALLDGLFEAVLEPRFAPVGWRGNAHYQTIWPNRIERDPGGPELARSSSREIIEAEDGDTLQVFWSSHASAASTAFSPRAWNRSWSSPFHLIGSVAMNA